MKQIAIYVKTHSITGLKYFGKTSSKNPNLYIGSGTYWRRHLKKHGNFVDTEILGIFTDKISLQLYCLEFSHIHNIINSKKWANLKEETGLDGGWEAINNGNLAHKTRCSNAGKQCHINHPDLSKKLPKMTSITAKKIVSRVKEIHGNNFYKDLASNKIMTDSYRKALSNAQTGMKMINNGVINTFVKYEKLNQYLSAGWYIGKLKKISQ